MLHIYGLSIFIKSNLRVWFVKRFSKRKPPQKYKKIQKQCQIVETDFFFDVVSKGFLKKTIYDPCAHPCR